MDRIYWRYTKGMLLAGLISIMLFFVLGTCLDRTQSGYHYNPHSFWEMRLEFYGGIPFWFAGMLAIILVHGALLFRLAYLNAQLQWRHSYRWGTQVGLVEAHAPVHVLKVLGIDFMLVVWLVCFYQFLVSHPWYC